MNTIGKILVVCVFVIALATAALLGMVFVVKQNFKKGLDDRDVELQVYKSKVQTSDKTLADLNIQVKKAEEDTKTAVTNAKTKDESRKAEFSKLEAENVELNVRVTDSDLKLQVYVQEKNRLKEEVEALLATLKKREERIITLEEDVLKQRNLYLASKSETDTFRNRNINLLDKIKDLTKQNFELQTKGLPGTLTNITKDPNAPNPPAVAVKGQVDEINPKDKSLVKLSVGSDHGVNTNHTLEVYRTQPRAEYLGTIRIIESNPHWSLGKMMPRSGQQHSPLQAGDTVVGSLSP